MNRDLTSEELERYADGEIEPAVAADIEQHLFECARCAAAALQIMRMKRAIRDVVSEEAPSAALRERVRRQIEGSTRRRGGAGWWVAAAAIVALAFVTVFLARRPAQSALPELVDMHVTLLASANPVDVVSTDRHTVKPWFEGKLPFTVPVPDLAGTPFRLIGGRVVYWRGNPGAYLLIGKAAHRISVFVFRDDTAPRNLAEASSDGVTTTTWHSGGLTFIAVAQVPSEDLQALRSAFRPQS
jgi:anti-sigma factor RsiW